MKIVSNIRSPNFSDLRIPVEFVVLHYTAASLESTLELFTTAQTEVSAHIVIDRDGSVYELVECLDGMAKRAWHAGKSVLESYRTGVLQKLDGFNDFSLGIELVNFNGNVFPYTEAQYSSLFSLIHSLKGWYPALKHPEAIVGHEQIAGFRGKADPGRYFDWERMFAVCYPNQGAPPRARVCSEQLSEQLRALVFAMGVTQEPGGHVKIPAALPATFFSLISSFLEASLAERHP